MTAASEDVILLDDTLTETFLTDLQSRGRTEETLKCYRNSLGKLCGFLPGRRLSHEAMRRWPEALREQWGADYAHNMARIRQAVTDTDGQYLTYGGQLIRAVFHASSAGATESSAALWSGDAPYLVSVSSPETAQDVPNYVSTAEIAADAVRAAVLDSYPDCVLGDDPGTWFGTPELDDSGRVARIPVGSETLTGAQVRALFSLRSAAFSVAYSGGTFTFTVTGSGHGVGMSQYGANVMAIRGSGYADILAHYYPGTTLIRAEG